MGELVTISQSLNTTTMALDFTGPQWIWTNELKSPGGNVPPGPRAFRRFIRNPHGVSPVYAKILITVDDAYTLYINENQVGTGNNLNIAQSYCVPVDSKYGVLIAVTAVNAGSTPNPAGLLAKIEITYDDGTTQIVASDTAWKALNHANFPSDYISFSFDDSTWPDAVTEGVDGSAPWSWIKVPSSISSK